jgi:muramoyltetrapeptide carboxypeptidase
MSNPSNNRRSFLKKAALATAALAVGQISSQANSKIEFIDGKKIILPPRLKSGDTIALTAPAGAIFNEDSIQKATVSFESQGFNVLHGNTLTQKYGYLAGHDQDRAQELTDLFQNKEVNGIVAMRGGWGCARILQYLDFEIIAKNPKVISGFSDITSLLLAIHAKTGMITFHGPVGNSTLDGFTMEQFLRLVKDGEAVKMIQPAENPVTVFSKGNSSGTLIGGNLTVWNSLIGTEYHPSIESPILFFEETEEEPYQIDRMLTQLDMNGAFRSVSGIIFGQWTKCVAEEPEKSFTLDEVLHQKFDNLVYPVVSGFQFGHIKDKFTFPIGALATFDSETSTLEINHTCVS